jgi:hypothetical protein
MFTTRSTLTVALLLMPAGMAHGQNILYQHDFSGLATTPLHRQFVDVDNNGGGTTWITRTDTGLPAGTGIKWFDDGSIDAALPGAGAAALGFSPLPGNIYTLTARFNAIPSGAPGNWVALGFSSGWATGSGGGAEFFGNGSPSTLTGRPWMIYRNASDGGFPNQVFLGEPNPTGGGANWPTPITTSPGDPVDLRIVLNTTPANWTVEWLAKRPTDGAFTSIHSAAYATNPTIRAVAITALDSVAGSIDSFTLTTSGLTYSAGDTNGNGVADLVDFDTIRNNFFNAVLGPTSGDLNNDGTVDYTDFRVWKGNATPAALAALGIPEPSSVVLAAAALLFVVPLVGQRRQARRTAPNE